MARSVAKKSKPSTKPSSSVSISAPSGPPPPFTTAPAKLAPFLDTLDPRDVYVTHIDRHPADFKRRIFKVPVALNMAIAALLLLRLYYAVPTYLALLAHILGFESPATIDTASTSNQQLALLALKRGGMFLADFLAFRFVGPWPVAFFLQAPANPLTWRWTVGFREREIAVRVSRVWGAKELLREGEGGGKVAENAVFKSKILPAVDRVYVRQKSAYLMIGRDWELDFGAMTLAHRLVDDGATPLALEDFDKSVFVYSETRDEWLCWAVWELDAESADADTQRKISAMKERLTRAGKESLFFRWIEIVQYESSAEGDFTIERQRRTLKKVEEAFDKEGVDFAELIESVGGMDGMPGMT